MEKLQTAILTVVIVGMSLIGFVLMGVDKYKAKKRKWRIPEKTLFTVAFLGGGIGCYLGMYAFRHKTKHRKFVILLPLSALLYVLILLKLYQII